MSPSEQAAKTATRPSARAAQITPLQEHFLDRLAALALKRDQVARQDPQDKLEFKLVSRALYTALMDCVAAGVSDRAHAMLDIDLPKRTDCRAAR
ncbi:MAG: hypothetical protein EXR49_06860 [Dehalococcoidia bacterium]|nr:hypothetical protein [Dehalococcoidia bacterium]